MAMKETMTMKSKTIIILALVVLAIVIILQNSEMVTLQLFFWKIMMSRIIFMVGLLAVGFVLGILVTKRKAKP
jgi:uncharacterized integral membrane protein